MKIQVYQCPLLSTNAYVVSSYEQCVVIDPSYASTATLLKYIGSNKCVGIWLTHSHWDHIADLAPLSQALGVGVCLHPNGIDNILNPGSDMIPFECEINPFNGEVTFCKDGDLLCVGTERFIVKHAPGHSHSSICFMEEKYQLAFTGDVVFDGRHGSTHLPGGDANAMQETMQMLLRCPMQPKTVLYPGHGAPLTWSEQYHWIVRCSRKSQ